MKVEDIKSEPIEYLMQKRMNSDQQRYELDMLQSINRRHADMRKNDPNLEARHPILRARVPHADAGAEAFRSREGV
jgi:hypothetical protein